MTLWLVCLHVTITHYLILSVNSPKLVSMELPGFKPDINLPTYEWCLTLILDCEPVGPLQYENSYFTLQSLWGLLFSSQTNKDFTSKCQRPTFIVYLKYFILPNLYRGSVNCYIVWISFLNLCFKRIYPQINYHLNIIPRVIFVWYGLFLFSLIKKVI